MSYSLLRFSILVALVGMSGCTHRALRRNTVNVAADINELHQQQVLDNVAMFVANPDALPHFALPGSGTSQVNDFAKLDTPLGLGRFGAGLFGITSFNINPGISRTAQQSWGLAPVNDPRKLELMRCAYQRAVTQCGVFSSANGCQDCEKLWNRFYTGDPDKRPDYPLATVSAQCLDTGNCWFCVGCKKCASRQSKCQLVGEYCGTYVWIPATGRDEFTNLTLTILDIVFNSPPAPPGKATKEVTLYLDENDKLVSWREAKQQVRAIVPVDRHNDVVLRAAYLAELEELLKKYGLIFSNLGNLPVENWSSADLGRLDTITNFLQLSYNPELKHLSIPDDLFDNPQNQVPSLMETLPPPPPAPLPPAGDLLQLRRELDRVTVPQQPF